MAAMVTESAGTTALSQRPLKAPDPERPRLRTLEGRWHRAAAVLVLAVLGLGLLLRFWTRSPLWLDEALTVNIARLPLHQMHGALERDGAPPLYYWLLHFWMKFFGTSDVALRSLSGLLSVLTLPVAWIVGRRLGGRTVAWAALLLLASAPFAIYYATEVRMYALVIFLTAVGWLAVDRALHKPKWGNLLAVAVVTAALLYSQYWSIYLIVVVALCLGWKAWRADLPGRRAVFWALGAMGVGVLAFLPWVPTFLYQTRHTGTPWATPSGFGAVINAITGFTQNQAALVNPGSKGSGVLTVFYFLLPALALFGVAQDRLHIQLDLRTRPRARWLTVVVFGTLFLAIAGEMLSSSTFSPRYASVVFLPLVLLAALGITTFLDPRLRAGVLLVVAAAGLAVAVPNIWTERTQAAPVANVLRAHAHNGDLVAFCPDQLGPATYRLLPNNRFWMTTFPRQTSPAFVDWVDYLSTARQGSADTFAEQLALGAGSNHRIWLVWAPGYRGFSNKCEEVSAELSGPGGDISRTWVRQDPATYYEPMTLQEFSAPK